MSQNEVDLLSSHRIKEESDPYRQKGIDQKTLQMILSLVSGKTHSFSVAEITQETQMSRVSVKKYLDYLCDEKVLLQTYVYGNKGRPSNLYRLLSKKQLSQINREREAPRDRFT